MKKILAIVLALTCALALLAGCGKTPEETTDNASSATTENTAESTSAATDDPSKKSDGVMTYAEYNAAAKDDAVVIEAYLQAKQAYKSSADGNGKASLYLADMDGAYFVYGYACTEEEYNALTVGMKLKVEGTKGEWAEEPEVTDATVTVEEGSYIAVCIDVTSLLGTDELAEHKNQYCSFNGGVVSGMDDGKSAFYYNYNGTGVQGNDLYFNVNFNGTVYSFTVESDLCGAETDVYKTVESLKIGDIVDISGFLYWYYGLNTHSTGVIVTGNVNDKSAGVMTYAEFDAAAKDDAVVIEAYLQAKQAYKSSADGKGKASLYLADMDGAYFVYGYVCTEEEYNALTVGMKLKLEGYKSEWAEEPEVIDAVVTAEDGKYVAVAMDATSLLGTDELAEHKNQYCTFKGGVVSGMDDGKSAFYYNYNGTGVDGNDLYFNVTFGDTVYSFTVESDLCGAGTAVYEAVKSLKLGDTVDITGFLYWYNGLNAHTTSVKVVTK